MSQEADRQLLSVLLNWYRREHCLPSTFVLVLKIFSVYRFKLQWTFFLCIRLKCASIDLENASVFFFFSRMQTIYMSLWKILSANLFRLYIYIYFLFKIAHINLKYWDIWPGKEWGHWLLQTVFHPLPGTSDLLFGNWWHFEKDHLSVDTNERW